MKFRFELERSNKKDHQAENVKCAQYTIAGTMDAHSIYTVADSAMRFMWLPGVYSLRIRNADAGCDWRDFGPIDTRQTAEQLRSLDGD